MILRFMFKLALMLVAGLTLSVLVAPAQTEGTEDVAAFFTVPDDCHAPCFIGLRPGVTTVGAAEAGLRAHAWVEDVSVKAFGDHEGPAHGYGEIRWQWSGQQSPLIDASHPGRASFRWDRDIQASGQSMQDVLVETVVVHTRIRLYSAQTWLGTPDSGRVSERLDQQLKYVSNYHFAGPPAMLRLSGLFNCPTSLMTYWHTRAEMEMSIWHSTGDPLGPLELVQAC
jgi:hypothetical protein